MAEHKSSIPENRHFNLQSSQKRLPLTLSDVTTSYWPSEGLTETLNGEKLALVIEDEVMIGLTSTNQVVSARRRPDSFIRRQSL
ncbi:MAG: hypothetical protein CFE29_20855 [Bradyrhizobiaceae bacterium PARB1]|jgi:hypothetical protein|nr:MAG: hypothetical protein CFE29_20855 [Bradyrhizobiaceae bacterium PARB1]